MRASCSAPAPGDRGDDARVRRGRRTARTDGLDARRARQAPLRPRRDDERTACLPGRARRRPGLRPRSTASPVSRRPAVGCAAVRAAARRRGGAAAPARRAARRSLPRGGRTREPASSSPSSARSSASRRRTASAPTWRPRSSAPTTGSARRDARDRPQRPRGRPSIHGDDALAWALARAGRCATRDVTRSVRSGSARGTRSLLPPRHDRALPRQRPRGTAVVPPRAATEPPLLAPLEQTAREVRGVRRVLALLACLAALSAPSVPRRIRSGTSRSTATATVELSGGRIYVHYVLDLAEIPTFQLGDAVASRASPPRLRAASSSRSTAGGSGCGRSSTGASGGRAPAASRRCASTPSTRRRPVFGSSLTLRDRNFGSRIGWREIVVRARDGAELPAPACPRRARATSCAPTRKTFSARRSTCRRPPLASRSVADPGRRPRSTRPAPARGRRLRGADVPRGPLARRDPALARARRLLGRRSRAHSRAREGDRRRVSGRHEGAAARRRAARGDRDRHPHDRRLRARPRHARSSRSSSFPSRSTRG